MTNSFGLSSTSIYRVVFEKKNAGNPGFHFEGQSLHGRYGTWVKIKTSSPFSIIYEGDSREMLASDWSNGIIISFKKNQVCNSA